MPRRLALILACLLPLSAPAVAEDQEWVLRIKQEAKQLSISLGGTTLYGSGAARIKGSGVAVDKARALAAFSRIRAEGPIDLRLSPAAQSGVRVQADDNIEPLILTQVEGETLVVSIKDGASFSSRLPLRVQVDFKQLQGLALTGSGDARIEQLKGERFEAELSGSGDLSLGLVELKELQARLSGSGDLRLAGQAERAEFQLSGSGDVSAASLSASKVRARLSGSGDLRLGVSQELEAELSGSGDLSYAGRPRLQSRVSGSGELIAR